MHRAFAGAIRQCAFAAQLAPNRTEVHHRAAALRAHMARRRARHEEHAICVDGHYAQPLIICSIEAALARNDTGGIDHRMQTAKALYSLCNSMLAKSRVAHIAGDGDDIRAKRARLRFGRNLVLIDDGHAGAGFGEDAGGGRAHARCAAGDQRAAASKIVNDVWGVHRTE